MPPISAQTKVYLALNAADMRKSFRGLITLTEAVLRKDPASGHLFVFLNRRRDMIKVLYWDGSAGSGERGNQFSGQGVTGQLVAERGEGRVAEAASRLGTGVCVTRQRWTAAAGSES